MGRHTTTTVAMPAALVHYWTMWNEPDLDRIRTHLDAAVTPEVEWADPLHHHRGRDALEANVRTLRSTKPEYRFVIASEIDAHHDRLRYRWDMLRRHRVLVSGLDVVTLADDGLIARVDGFFGTLPDVAAENSGVPTQLHPTV